MRLFLDVVGAMDTLRHTYHGVGLLLERYAGVEVMSVSCGGDMLGAHTLAVTRAGRVPWGDGQVEVAIDW